MDRKRTDIRDEQGQAITEFALVLPVLALLLFAVIQFGVLFNNYLTLTDAVRAGARTAAVSRRDASPAGAAEARVRQAAADLDQAQLAVSVSSSWEHGSDVAVTASYPYKIDLLGFVLADGRLTSTTTERVE